MNRFYVCVILLCMLLMPQVSAQDGNSRFDYYSPLIEWQQPSGLAIAPIHVGLLPNGKLFFLNQYNFFQNPDMDLTTPGFMPEFPFVMEPTPAFTPEPASVLIQPMVTSLPPNFTYNELSNSVHLKTLICGGYSLMADGNLFFACGAEADVDLDIYNSGDLWGSVTVEGLSESLTYNPFTDTWIENPDIIGIGPLTGEPRRWYATVTRLADSRMLVTGGYESVHPNFSPNISVEVFDPATNSWSMVSNLEDTPKGIENPDYPHVFQFPYDYVYEDGATSIRFDQVFMIGGSAEPLIMLLNGVDKYWHHTNNYRPGAKEFIDSQAPKKVFPNHGSTSALLPIRLPEDGWGYSNGSIINVGGAHFTPMEGNIDVYDPAANSWRPSIPLGGLRHHASSVILPDGRILILAGHDDVSEISQTGYAQYVDPKNNFALSQGLAYMPEIRGYHSVTVLLPDGRVLLGGGNETGKDEVEFPHFRYYYPDYMFNVRPQISYMQETLDIGDYSLILVPHMTDLDEATLMGLGAMTHSFDMSQRSVQLRVHDPDVTVRFESGGLVIVEPEQCLDNPELCYDIHLVEAPASPEIAPPGYYMLFILDKERIPSVAKMVKLQ